VINQLFNFRQNNEFEGTTKSYNVTRMVHSVIDSLIIDNRMFSYLDEIYVNKVNLVSKTARRIDFNQQKILADEKIDSIDFHQNDLKLWMACCLN